MSDGSIPVGSTGERLQTYLNEIAGLQVHSEAVTLTDQAGVPHTAAYPVPVGLPQSVDANNTKVISSADASPGSPWVGAATPTRGVGIVGILLTVISTAPIAGTYTFEFGEDGATWPISITVPVEDFSTIRFRQLLNVGAYYRAKFEPATAMGGTLAIITSQLARQSDPAFVVPAGHVFEEQDAAFGQTFSFAKLFNARTGKSVNMRPDDTGAQRVADDRIAVSQSGATRVTGIRDDISIHFFDGLHVDDARGIYDDGSVNGTVTFDAVEGRAVFAVPATAGSTCIYRSMKRATYEAAHTIRGEQTIYANVQPTGAGFIEWGFGDANNTVGWRFDVDGLHVIRRKNGVLESKVAQADWNRDRCLADDGSLFLFNFEPQVLDPLKNNRYAEEYEWLGVAPPDYYVVAPNKRQVNVHVEEFPNQHTGTTIPNPELPMFVHIRNDGAQAIAVACGSWRGGTLTNNVITYGQQPDGDYVADKADGTVFTSSTNLAASGVFQSEIYDTDGWTTIEIFIASDQVSASDGIELQFIDDVQGAANVRGTEKFTFTAADVARGFIAMRRNATLDGFRLRYTNGGVPTTNLYIAVQLREPPSGPPLNTLEASIDATSVAQMTRSAIFAKDGGTYDLIGKGTNGGLDIGIVQHEVNTPIKSDTSLTMSTGTVDTAGAKIVDIAAVPAGATTVCIQAANNNGNAVIYLATSQAGSVGGTSAGADIAAGQSWTYSVGTGLTTDIWGASSTGTARWRKTWLIGGGA